MSEDEARREVVALLFEKADQALAAARRDLAAGDYNLTLNRVYYACLYAVSAVITRRASSLLKPWRRAGYPARSAS